MFSARTLKDTLSQWLKEPWEIEATKLGASPEVEITLFSRVTFDRMDLVRGSLQDANALVLTQLRKAMEQAPWVKEMREEFEAQKVKDRTEIEGLKAQIEQLKVFETYYDLSFKMKHGLEEIREVN